jgi:hypothetical protein
MWPNHASIGARVVSHVTRNAIAKMMPLLATSAHAADVMEFKPVPAESVTSIERRARRTHVTEDTKTPALPTPPAEPTPTVDEPDVPVAPTPARVEHSGDLVRFGSDIHVPSDQEVSGDVVAIGGDITVDGRVQGDVVAVGGSVTLGSAAHVEGQLVTVGGQLHEAPGSYAGGSRVTAGGLPKRWASGRRFWPFMSMFGSGMRVMLSIMWMLFMMGVAWAITQLAPARTRAAFDSLKREGMMCFALGLLAWALLIPSVIALALVAAVLCITIIGIPLALAVIVGYVGLLILLCVWGYVVGAIALGERLWGRFRTGEATLTVFAIWGIGAVSGVRILGHMFGILPLGGFPGGILVVLGAVTSVVLMTLGAGSLLRSQARREQMSQWWPRRAAPAGMSGTYVPPIPPIPPPPPVPPMTPMGGEPPATSS